MKVNYLTLFLLLILCAGDIAAETEINGIWYELYSQNRTAKVVCKGSSYETYVDEYTGTVVIPDSVICNGVVYNVTSIGSSSFRECKKLKSVVIPNSVTTIEAYAFCRSGLKYITIGEGVTSIGNSAFWDTPIRSITIPKNVVKIGECAIHSCDTVTMEPEVPPTIKEGSYTFFSGYQVTIFVPCGAIDAYKNAPVWKNYRSRIKYAPEQKKQMLIENGLIEQTRRSCQDSISLTAIPNYGYHFTQWSDGYVEDTRTIEVTQEITFTAEFAIDKSGTCGENNALIWSYDDQFKTLTIIGEGVLTNNYMYGVEAPTKMNTLIIGNGMTAIGDSAFYGMSTINHLVIGANVASIGSYAFAECRNFDDITSYASIVPTIDYTTFYNVGNKQYIYLFVPEDRERAYKRDTWWGQFDIHIKGAEETTTDGNVTVLPTDNTVEITWPSVNNAETYEIVITKDGEVVCTLIFNANGQLTGIAFAPSRNNTQQAQTAGFRFTVTGLTSNTHYGYAITSKDAEETTIDTKSGSFTTSYDGQSTEGFEDVLSTDKVSKSLRDGQILIIRGDKTYTLTGQEIIVP